MGTVNFPEDFDPTKHNMFWFADEATRNERVYEAGENTWSLITPFCLHRRNPVSNGKHRTFARISCIDIEVRDKNCTQNPLLPTEAYGRDPVKTYRDLLTRYEG